MLSGVTIQVHPGNLVGIIGPNGGGKSTLLKAIAGVIRPRRGEIRLGERPARDLAQWFAYVPQREDVNWEFPVSARDVVLMGRYRSAGWLRFPGRADRRAAERALERLGLPGMGHRHISQFSGGQQQRIFLARALVQEPRVVLLDEPFTGIDAENRRIVHELLKELQSQGAIVLMATHDLDEVSATCSHICCLNRRFIAFGPTTSTYTPENLRATFGGRLAVFT